MAQYRANLAALRGLQPDVASRVEATIVPEGVQPAIGRDGSATFLIPAPGAVPREGTEGLHWFGASSMPRISAVETLASFRNEGTNVALPGFLTGLEPIVVGHQSPPFCAVFVIERDPVQIKLAFHLYDYVPLLQAGRLVIVPDGWTAAPSETSKLESSSARASNRTAAGGPREADALTAMLIRFFESHPGYELPPRMVTVPQRSPAELAALQRRLQDAGGAVIQAKARMAEGYVGAIRRRMQIESSIAEAVGRPRVAVIGVDPRPGALSHAAGVAQALQRLGWPFELCVPDCPTRCHAVARLQAIEGSNCDFVLCLSGFAGSMRSTLPPELPVVNWFPPNTPVPAHVETPLAARDLALVTAKSDNDRLLKAGVPPQQVRLCEPAVDETVIRPVTLDEADIARWGGSVAVLANLPDDRPEAAGVSLPSHFALWRALQDAVRRDPDRYRDAAAEAWLDRALKASGTSLRDTPVRQHFIELLRSRIAPVGVAAAYVDALAAANIGVTLWGTNWAGWPREKEVALAGVEFAVRTADAGSVSRSPRDHLADSPSGAVYWRGPIPIAEELNLLLNGHELIVLLAPTSGNILIALQALSVGARAACRGSVDVVQDQYPRLADVVTHLAMYDSRQALVGIVRRLPSVSAGKATEAQLIARPCGSEGSARAAVLAEHTLAHRLRDVRDWLSAIHRAPGA